MKKKKTGWPPHYKIVSHPAGVTLTDDLNSSSSSSKMCLFFSSFSSTFNQRYCHLRGHNRKAFDQQVLHTSQVIPTQREIYTLKSLNKLRNIRATLSENLQKKSLKILMDIFNLPTIPPPQTPPPYFSCNQIG